MAEPSSLPSLPPAACRADTLVTLDALRARIRTLERGGVTDGVRGPLVPTRWPSIDRLLGGGIPRGVVSEWIGIADAADDAGASRDGDVRPADSPEPREKAAAEERGPRDARGRGARPPAWTPPVSLLVHVASAALDVGERAPTDGTGDSSDPDDAGPLRGVSAGPVLFIGRRVWPYPRRLVVSRALFGACSDDRQLLTRAIFVDPEDDGARLWAIDLALRCRAVAAVIADGSGFLMAASRRLQLAAEAGLAFALLARPSNEIDRPSAAAIRFLVQRDARGGEHNDAAASRPRWRVALLRAKGTKGAPSAAGVASIETASTTPRPVLLEGDPVRGVVQDAVEDASGTQHDAPLRERARPSKRRGTGVRAESPAFDFSKVRL